MQVSTANTNSNNSIKSNSRSDSWRTSSETSDSWSTVSTTRARARTHTSGRSRSVYNSYNASESKKSCDSTRDARHDTRHDPRREVRTPRSKPRGRGGRINPNELKSTISQQLASCFEHTRPRTCDTNDRESMKEWKTRAMEEFSRVIRERLETAHGMIIESTEAAEMGMALFTIVMNRLCKFWAHEVIRANFDLIETMCKRTGVRTRTEMTTGKSDVTDTNTRTTIRFPFLHDVNYPEFCAKEDLRRGVFSNVPLTSMFSITDALRTVDCAYDLGFSPHMKNKYDENAIESLKNAVKEGLFHSSYEPARLESYYKTLKPSHVAKIVNAAFEPSISSDKFETIRENYMWAFNETSTRTMTIVNTTYALIHGMSYGDIRFDGFNTSGVKRLNERIDALFGCVSGGKKARSTKAAMIENINAVVLSNIIALALQGGEIDIPANIVNDDYARFGVLVGSFDQFIDRERDTSGTNSVLTLQQNFVNLCIAQGYVWASYMCVLHASNDNKKQLLRMKELIEFWLNNEEDMLNVQQRKAFTKGIEAFQRGLFEDREGGIQIAPCGIIHTAHTEYERQMYSSILSDMFEDKGDMLRHLTALMLSDNDDRGVVMLGNEYEDRVIELRQQADRERSCAHARV